MPGDFPPRPRPAEGSPSLALAVDVLRELIAKTHFSISGDETRAHLNSALFEWDGDILRMVTTDGHRLSKIEVKVSGRQASGDDAHSAQGDSELRRLCDEMLGDGEEIAKEGTGPELQIHAEQLERVLPGRRRVVLRAPGRCSVSALRTRSFRSTATRSFASRAPSSGQRFARCRWRPASARAA